MSEALSGSRDSPLTRGRWMGEDCECLLPGERAGGGELGIPGFRRNCSAGGSQEVLERGGVGLRCRACPWRPSAETTKSPTAGRRDAVPVQRARPGSGDIGVPNGAFATIVDGTID